MAKVLVVDDEYGIRLTLREFLQDDGHQVDTAESFDEAIGFLRNNSYDVLVTDIILPRRNGLDLLRHIHDTNPEVQVIIITGEPTVELTVQAMRLGAFDFIAKPVSGNDLCEVVHEAALKKSQFDQAEEMLRESESRYHMLFDAAADAIFIFDLYGHVQEVNYTTNEITGFSRSELLACTWNDLFSNLPESLQEPPDDEGLVHETTLTRKKKPSLAIELNIRRVTYFGESGWIFIARDISKRRKTEEQLLRFSAAVHASTDAVVINDLEGVILQVNKAAVRMFGADHPDELRGKHGTEFLDPSILRTIRKTHLEQGSPETFQPTEYALLRKDGSQLAVEASISIMHDAEGAPQGYATILRDITERKQAEEALRRSEERLATTLSCLSDLVFGINHRGIFAEFHQPASHPDLYTEPEQFLNHHVGDVLPRSVAERFLSALRNVEQQKGIFEFNYELEVHGKTSWFSARCSPRLNEHGKKDGILAVVRNINAPKRAEIRAKQVSKELAFLVESAHAFMQHSPQQDLYTQIGRHLRRLISCRVIINEYCPETDSLVCRSIQGLGPATHKILAMMGGSPVGRAFPITDEQARKDILSGRVMEVPDGIRGLVFNQFPEFICNLISQALDIGKIYAIGFVHAEKLLGTCIIILQRNEEIPHQTVEAFAGQASIALNREFLANRGLALENQLHQARKLESLGRLTSSVAHDFNNVLTGLIGNVTLAKMELPADHPASEYLDQASEAVDKASELTSQLLGVSRKREIKRQSLELSELIASNRTLLQRLLGEDISLKLELASGLPSLTADRGHLEQVLLNLAANARDALPEGGQVKLRTWREERSIELFTGDSPWEAPQEFVKLSFEDNGPGMDDSIRHVAFEAFFSTKAPGKGTGLGLATVAEVMQSLGGEVSIETPEQGGTRFVLSFPVGQHSSTSFKLSGRPIPGGTEMILVMEEDEQVRRTLQNSLISLGYQVIASTNPDELCSEVLKTEALPSLLIADQVTQEDYMLLREHFPMMRFLFTSGNQDGVVIHTPFDWVGSLNKPFNQQQLAVKIRDILR